MPLKTSLLLTNDDGIDSPLLGELVAALRQSFNLRVVAPDGQRSWSGVSITRERELTVLPDSRFGLPAWTTDGTPADGVSLALGHLLKQPVSAVISGINIGQNAGMPLIYSSGTVGAAIEAALMGYPAVALSMQLSPPDYASARSGDFSPALFANLKKACVHAHDWLLKNLPLENRMKVHNINYPVGIRDNPTTIETVPARTTFPSIFEGIGGGKYRFCYRELATEPSPVVTDIECLEAGDVSHSLLDFGAIARV